MPRRNTATFGVVKVTTKDPQTGRKVAESMTFRLGQPVDQATADARWARLDKRARAGRLHVNVDGRAIPVAFLENRTVDRFGRGLGRPDHFTAARLPLRRDSRAPRPVR